MAGVKNQFGSRDTEVESDADWVVEKEDDGKNEIGCRREEKVINEDANKYQNVITGLYLGNKYQNVISGLYLVTLDDLTLLGMCQCKTYSSNDAGQSFDSTRWVGEMGTKQLKPWSFYGSPPNFR